MKGIGLSRVAAAAGVSVATVSNTINRPHMVSESTRQRVEDAMRRLEFVPNRAAATLRSGYNRLLGVVVPELVNPFYASITEAIAVTAAQRGYAVALCVSHDDAAVELSHFEMLAEQRAAGAIVVPYSASGLRLRQLRMVGTHLVLVDRVVDEHDGCSVAVDDIAGGALAADHLRRTPGRGLTLVNGPTSIPQCRDRRLGVIGAEASAGDELTEFTSAHMTVDEGIEIGRRIADTGAPRRIFCTNDQLAVGVVRGLRERGILTPRDAKIVGYGDLALAVEGDIRLTSVAQPKERLGEEAVAKVLSEIEDATGHQHSTTILAPRLILRDSAPQVA